MMSSITVPVKILCFQWFEAYWSRVTTSTWLEFGQLISDGRFSILLMWKHVQVYRL